MIGCKRLGVGGMVAAIAPLALLTLAAAPSQEPDAAAVIQRIDAAARARYENVLGFTVTEHYAVFRGKDETHPAAEMTVKTTYTKGIGKSYAVLSQSGSAIILRFGLQPLLDGEKNINLPGNVERSWFTSANYQMTLKPGPPHPLNGHNCLAIGMVPIRKAPNMIEGTLWVDASDDSIVQIEGIASKSPSVWTGPPRMMRQYTTLSGFAMATHARAVSNSLLFGRTMVTIDYRDYQIQLASPK